MLLHHAILRLQCHLKYPIVQSEGKLLKGGGEDDMDGMIEFVYPHVNVPSLHR